MLGARTVEERPKVLVSVFNKAGVDDATVLLAEKMVSQIYEEAGLSIIWKNCLAQPECWRLNVVAPSFGAQKSLACSCGLMIPIDEWACEPSKRCPNSCAAPRSGAFRCRAGRESRLLIGRP